MKPLNLFDKFAVFGSKIRSTTPRPRLTLEPETANNNNNHHKSFNTNINNNINTNTKSYHPESYMDFQDFRNTYSDKTTFEEGSYVGNNENNNYQPENTSNNNEQNHNDINSIEVHKTTSFGGVDNHNQDSSHDSHNDSYDSYNSHNSDGYNIPPPQAEPVKTSVHPYGPDFADLTSIQQHHNRAPKGTIKKTRKKKKFYTGHRAQLGPLGKLKKPSLAQIITQSPLTKIVTENPLTKLVTKSPIGKIITQSPLIIKGLLKPKTLRPNLISHVVTARPLGIANVTPVPIIHDHGTPRPRSHKYHAKHVVKRPLTNSGHSASYTHMGGDHVTQRIILGYDQGDVVHVARHLQGPLNPFIYENNLIVPEQDDIPGDQFSPSPLIIRSACRLHAISEKYCKVFSY